MRRGGEFALRLIAPGVDLAMLSKLSIQIKYTLAFLLLVSMVVFALLIGFYNLKSGMLRNEAQAVANQVVAFRSWVAGSGMVWVDRLSTDFHDFLAKRPAESGKFYFGKNPALATRELSDIVNRSTGRATFRATSDRYRQPKNKPDGFELDAIARLKADDDLDYVEGYVGDNYRYAMPLYITQACLRCHGDPKDAPKEVLEKYGDKNAFGYKLGEVRGIISVQLPDLTLAEAAASLLNPYSIGLVVGAFALNYLFAFLVIGRLRNLTEITERIAKGEMDLEVRVNPNSKDEIDHIHEAVDLLRKSLQVAMRRMRKK